MGALLLAVGIALGLRAWSVQQRDPCDEVLAGGRRRVTVYVESGTRTVEMPCDMWIPRQPAWVQAALILELAVVVVMGLSVAMDWRRRRQSRDVP